MPRRPIAALAVAAALAASQPAPAQDDDASRAAASSAGSRDPQSAGVQMFVSVGWAGRIVAETWTPITITLQGAPGGGGEPMQGSVVIEYAQDATQSASITVPVMAMPDRTTEFVAAVCLPILCDTVTCRLYDGATGRVLRSAVLSTAPTSVQLELPHVEGDADPVFASVGAAGAGGGAASTLAVLEDPTGARLRGTAPSRSVPASRLPLSWPAYSGLTVLAVDAAAARDVDPRAMTAIREWVAAGGHLVVIADGPGTEWRSWLPPSALGDTVTLDEPATIAPPGDLAGVLGAAAASTADVTRFPSGGRRGRLASGVHGPVRPRDDGDVETGDGPDDPEPDTTAGPESAPEPRARTMTPSGELSARTIRLTAAGEALGWRVRWRADAAPPAAAWVDAPGDESGRGAAGLLAEGPVGFGRVTIVGIDPRDAASPGDLAARSLWPDIVREALAAHERRVELAAADYYSRYGFHSSRSSEARRIIMDGLAGVPGGGGAFTVIVVAMLALALMLGPGDALLLGRLRLRHRSWLTALCWISLATVAAYTAPVVGRSAAIAVGRISVVDAILPAGSPAPGAPPGAPPAAPPAAALAWQTSITAVFSDRTMTASVLPYPRPGPEEARAAVPASWWRGISASELSTEFRPLGIFPSIQAAPDLTSERAQRDPWGGRGAPPPPNVPPPAPQSDAPPRPVPVPGGCTPLETLFRTWTFRSFQDEARVSPPCLVRVERSGPRGVRVQIPALPPGATIAHAACRTREGWHALSFEAADGGRLEAIAADAAAEAPAAWRQWQPSFRNPWVDRESDRSNVLDTPGMALALTPHVQRDDAIEQLLRYGRGLPAAAGGTREGGDGWAVVHLLLTGMPADVTLAGRDPDPRTIVCRIATPIEPPASPAPPPPPEPTP